MSIAQATLNATRRARRRGVIYGAMAAMAPKFFLAYRGWVWMGLFVQTLGMTIFVYFWRAIYNNNETVSGLTLQQTLNYVLLAQIIAPVAFNSMIHDMGWLLREGAIGIELLRPIDFQLSRFAWRLGDMTTGLIVNLPLLIIAILAFGLRLPADPLPWLCFAISLILGVSVFYFFDWAFSCLAFYTTEAWGLSVLREGFVNFFSGAFIPLVMMPGWLQSVARLMPFAQALYVPVSFLAGTVPVSEAPGVWLTQIIWLIAMIVLSRLVFRISVRKVTVQGG